MIRGAAPGRACLRVGPPDTSSLVAWWPERTSAGLLGGERSVSGTLVASDAQAADPRVMETADVIFTAGDAVHRARPAEWLGRTLGRYPGCEVAAIWNRHGECAVAVRNGWLRTLSLPGRHDAGVRAFACAVFVHGWLAARLPLAHLQPPRLEISDSDVVAARIGASMLHFRFCYAGSPEALGAGDPVGAAISANRRRTDSASGAPSSA